MGSPTKQCSKCEETKRVGEFYRSSRARDGRQGYCKACAKRGILLWREDNAEKNRRTARAWDRRNRPESKYRRYNISKDEFDRMLASQRGRCAICGRTAEEAHVDGKQLFVDHDHTCCGGGRSCGRCVRKLLCRVCNMGIGLFEESIHRLRAAIAYLEEHQSKNDNGNSLA